MPPTARSWRACSGWRPSAAFPLVGLNDSAGAYIPAGVGGLDGYADAFTALRKISGVVPSIMCMFGFNAGGGSYLPRQGSFMIQPNDTFFGLTGPGVVKSVLGEDVTPTSWAGPGCTARAGVTDFVVPDEVAALKKVRQLLNYLPSYNGELAPHQAVLGPHRPQDLGHRYPAEEGFQLAHRFQHPDRYQHPHPAACATTATSWKSSPIAPATPSPRSGAWAAT